MTYPHDHAGWETWAAAASVPVAIVATAIVAALGDARRAGARLAAAVARRRPACGLGVFAASLAISGGVAWHAGVPRPVVQDEFSYLLAADTFAHGRLTNPTPPAADTLQSPHELVRPTYTSKYPPGQGLTLAAGQVLAGLPIVGVWVTLALAAAAVYWAAGAFVPVPWAVMAGLLAAAGPQPVDWSHVYWGGGLAELGGALVIGAAARRNGWVLAAGLAVLANSRPYEGLALAVAAMVVLVGPGWRLQPPPVAAEAATPVGRWWALGIVLIPTAIWMGYDNARVTGHPLVPPIVAYARQFDLYPKLWVLPVRAAPPAYPNGSMAAVHLGFERGQYDALRTPAGLARVEAARLWRFAADGVGTWVLLVPLAASAMDRRARWVWAAVAATAAAVAAETFFLPHYAAPATAGLIVLVVVGWRRLATWWPAAGVGIGVAVAVTAAASAATIGVDPVRTGRDDVAAGLGGGRQLVFVRYGPGHASDDEWVYNDADPPAARVVWAHDGGAGVDAAVARAYPGRRAWLVTVGAADLRVDPYGP